MVPFTRLHVGVGEEELRGMVDVQNALQQIEDSLGVDLIMVPVTTDIQASLQNLDANAEAFYLTRISRLTWEQRKTFISELTSRKIATFSLLGHPDVEAGAMAGITPDIQEQVVRRVAINLSQVIRGVAVDELSIILTVDSKLLINAKTAKAVGYSPSLETLLFAEILHEEVLEAERRDLALADAMKMAVAGNTALSISDSEVETSKRDMQLARSVFLPQVSARASYEKNNIEAGLPISLGPEELTLAGIRATQLIYDDLAISNYRSSSRIYAGSRERREADRLDVLAEIGNAYYRVALADNRYRIVADNLKLTEDNLELSRLRQDIGYSGRDEVYRWEAELAQRRAGVFGSHAIRERGQIVLNQVLAGDQRVRFQIEEVPYENIDRYFLDGGLNVIFSSLKKIEKARSFVTNFALENAPELKFLDDFVASQQIQVSARKRRFFLPTVFANFFYEYRIDRTPDFPGGEKGFYVFEVTASYLLFLGGRRVYNVKREKSVLDGLEREKKLASERIEQRARVALRRLEASIPGVGFGHTASQSARQNLDIVNDKYALGIVNVTDLLEAQNESLRAELGAADAIYTYLLDLIEFQRSISWFQDERSQAEQDDFIKRLKAAISMP
jgi:outer membrane protein TolC